MSQVATTGRRLHRVVRGTGHFGIGHQGAIRIGPGAIGQLRVVIELVVMAGAHVGIAGIVAGKGDRIVGVIVIPINIIGSWVDIARIVLDQGLGHDLEMHGARIIQGKHDIGIGPGAEIEGNLGNIKRRLRRSAAEHHRESKTEFTHTLPPSDYRSIATAPGSRPRDQIPLP